MTCHEAAAYVGPYVDGELTVSDTLALDAHIATCRLCARLVDQQRAWSRIVQQAPRFRAPDALAARIRAARLPSESASNHAAAAAAAARTQMQPQTVTQPQMQAQAQSRTRSWTPWLAAAAALIVCAALTAMFWLWTMRTSGATNDLVAHDIVSSHVRSLMAQHLTDVPSSDRHTVKPWFGGKVPYTLVVPDLAGQEFILEGGRLDYIAGRTVAALVYRRHQHVINL